MFIFQKCDCHCLRPPLALHPFSFFVINLFVRWIFINAFFLFRVGSLYLWSFIYVIILPLSIRVAVKTSTIFMPLSAVCAIIERINPT